MKIVYKLKVFSDQLFFAQILKLSCMAQVFCNISKMILSLGPSLAYCADMLQGHKE